MAKNNIAVPRVVALVVGLFVIYLLFFRGSSEEIYEPNDIIEPPSRQVKDDGPKTAVQQLVPFVASTDLGALGANWKQHLPKPPKTITYDPQHKYFWNLVTNKGSMKFELRPDWAPYHVTSTIYLTLTKFYDDITFHRVIRGFMAQFGCPIGRGTAGPGYQYEGEFISKEAKHSKRGMLSTANAGKGTDGSQLFILFKPQGHLDGGHTVFGYMVEGEDTLAAIEDAAPKGQGEKPVEPLVINQATITVE